MIMNKYKRSNSFNDQTSKKKNFNCFSHFEDIHIIIIKMLSHKNRNKQMPVYSIQQHLELKKVVKLVKHVVSFIREGTCRRP